MKRPIFNLEFKIWLVCTAILMWLAMGLARADTNLTAICKGGTTSGSANCSMGIVYDYPGANQWVRTGSNAFYFWGVIGSASAVVICTADIPRGSPTCPAVSTLPKAQVPLSAPVAPSQPSGNIKLKVSWTPPTQGTLDGKTVTLQPGDITGYQIAWVPQSGGRGGEFMLAGTLSSITIDVPPYPLYISVSAKGKDAWGPSSPNAPYPAPPTASVIPGAPSGLKIEQVLP